jgi:sialic acid synthase SpsE
MFRQEELYGKIVGLPRTHELSRFWIPSLAQMALECDVEFMCSAFSEAGVEAITPYVAAHKVASCEATHPGIIEACKRSGIPTFVSSGAMHWDEYTELVSQDWPSGIIPTYCRASYPANDAQPWQFDRLIGWIKCLSDHTTDVYPLAMPRHGFCAIEKHVNFVGAAGPDADHSLSGEDFSRMVKFLRGQVADESPPKDILDYHRRRFVPELGGWYRLRKESDGD